MQLPNEIKPLAQLFRENGYWTSLIGKTDYNFDDQHLLNPGKVFPELRRCAEMGRMHISRGQVPFPDIPRF